MPISVVNHVPDMCQVSGTTANVFGKDQTQTVTYTLNQQGFRSNQEYNFIPDYAFFGASIVFGIGVDYDKIFASQFQNAQNYGLAGIHYTNNDIYQVVEQYVNSPELDPKTKILILWTDSYEENLEKYYNELDGHNIIHYFCGELLPYPRCYKFPGFATVDQDASGTHPGPKSHANLYKILCRQFNQ